MWILLKSLQGGSGFNQHNLLGQVWEVQGTRPIKQVFASFNLLIGESPFR